MERGIGPGDVRVIGQDELAVAPGRGGVVEQRLVVQIPHGQGGIGAAVGVDGVHAVAQALLSRSVLEEGREVIIGEGAQDHGVHLAEGHSLEVVIAHPAHIVPQVIHDPASRNSDLQR